MNKLDAIRYGDSMIPFPPFSSETKVDSNEYATSPMRFGEVPIGDNFLYNGVLLCKLGTRNAKTVGDRNIQEYMFNIGDIVKKTAIKSKYPKLAMPKVSSVLKPGTSDSDINDEDDSSKNEDVKSIVVNFQKSLHSNRYTAIVKMNDKEALRVGLYERANWTIKLPPYFVKGFEIKDSRIVYDTNKETIEYKIDGNVCCTCANNPQLYLGGCTICIDISNIKLSHSEPKE